MYPEREEEREVLEIERLERERSPEDEKTIRKEAPTFQPLS